MTVIEVLRGARELIATGECRSPTDAIRRVTGGEFTDRLIIDAMRACNAWWVPTSRKERVAKMDAAIAAEEAKAGGGGT